MDEPIEKRIETLHERLSRIEERVPDSEILSSNFLTRALAIWGHTLAIQLLFTVGIWVVILLVIGFIRLI